MPQETQFQYPAFMDVVRLCPPSENRSPLPNIRYRTSTTRNFTPESAIPLGWFRDPEWRKSIVEKFGGTSEYPMVQLVFNVNPVQRQIVLKKEVGKDKWIEETRFSEFEVPSWTSMGGWCSARADQTFIAPDWHTIFIKL